MSLEFLTWAMTMTIAIISIWLKERYVECRHHHAPAQTLRDHSTSMQELSTTHPKHDSLVSLTDQATSMTDLSTIHVHHT